MPIFTEFFLLLIRQNIIPYGQRLCAFDRTELCLVINLTKGGNWAFSRPPIFATGLVLMLSFLHGSKWDLGDD